MSNKLWIPEALFEASISALAFRIYVHLSRRYQEGLDSLSAKAIANHCGFSPSAAKRGMNELVALNIIKRHKLTGYASRFELVDPGDWSWEASPRNYAQHRETVFERDSHQCVYCGSSYDLTLDHIIPASRGGSHAIDNLCCCCFTCNIDKADRTPDEWMEGNHGF